MIRGMKYLAIAAALGMSAPTFAGWTLIGDGKPVLVAKSKKMKVTPSGVWNKWSARPSKKGEVWTRDGFSLNELFFLAEVAQGEPILKERNKKDKPLPKFKSDMLPTDLVDLYEGTVRIVLQTSKFEVGKVEPAKLGGHDAVRFQYTYVVGEEALTRRGEVVAANVGGKFYLVSFVAPDIEYFERDVEEFRKMVGSVVI
jgi:hypothetical protein